MSIDKSKEVVTSIALCNSKVQFKGEVDGNAPVLIDYIPPFGDNMGYTSLELFLLSLSSCVGTATLILLRKMNKNIDSFKIQSIGFRKAEHPTGFKSINITMQIKSNNISSDEMDKVIKMAEPICPVLSMIKEQVEIAFNYMLSE